MGEVGQVMLRYMPSNSENLHVSVDSNKYVHTCLTVHAVSLPFCIRMR